MESKKSDELKQNTIFDAFDKLDIEFMSRILDNFDEYKNLPAREERVNG